jgi:hypothetical protein
MANVAVTCIKNGRSDSFGRPLVSGTYYPSVEIETAKALWNSGYVSVADASVFDQDPLAGTSPLDDFNVARALSLSRQPAQTSANLAAELAAISVPVTLFQSGVAFAVFGGDGGSTGLLFTGTAGSFTLSSAVYSGVIVPSGYGYLPANAGGLGNAAGWYYFTMSSDTTGTFFNNLYLPTSEAAPAIPPSPQDFANPVGGRITQTVSELTCAQVTLPVGSVGVNGLISLKTKFIPKGSASYKTMRLRYGASELASIYPSLAGIADTELLVQMAGRLDRQISTRNNVPSGTYQPSVLGDFSAIDFSVGGALSVTLQNASSADSSILYVRSLCLSKGA